MFTEYIVKNFATDDLTGLTTSGATDVGSVIQLSANGGRMAVQGLNGYNSIKVSFTIVDGFSIILSDSDSTLVGSSKWIGFILRLDSDGFYRWYGYHGDVGVESATGYHYTRSPAMTHYNTGGFATVTATRANKTVSLLDLDRPDSQVAIMSAKSETVFDFASGGWDYNPGAWMGVMNTNASSPSSVSTLHMGSQWERYRVPANALDSNILANNAFTTNTNPWTPATNGTSLNPGPYSWPSASYTGLYTTSGSLRGTTQSAYDFISTIAPYSVNPQLTGNGSMFRILYTSGPAQISVLFGKNMRLKFFPTVGVGAGTNGIEWVNIDSKGGEVSNGNYTGTVLGRYIFFGSYNQTAPTTRTGTYSAPIAKLFAPSVSSTAPILTTGSTVLTDSTYALYSSVDGPSISSNNGSEFIVDNYALYATSCATIFPGNTLNVLPVDAAPGHPYYGTWTNVGGSRVPQVNDRRLQIIDGYGRLT